MFNDLTLRIDQPDFKATAWQHTIHAGREYLISQCWELIAGRWEGFVSMRRCDPADHA